MRSGQVDRLAGAVVAEVSGVFGMDRERTHRQAAPDEGEQRLRRLVIGLAQVGVDRAVVLALGGIGSRRDARLLQRLDEPLGLGGRLGMIGDVQDQERRDALVLGDVGDG